VQRVSRLRRALTFENVLVTVVAFAVLAGGTAIAANQLAKNSVGKKQLKANAVTTAKIKKNAVTKAKIRNGAVDTTKVKDASLTLADVDQASLPFGHVVHRAQSSSAIAVPASPGLGVVPLDGASYTQEAGRDDTVAGAVDLSFDAACEAPRVALAYVLVDSPDPSVAANESFVAAGQWIDTTTIGASTTRLNLGSLAAVGDIQPATATNHTLSLVLAGGCPNGNMTATNARLAVTGVK
jgi:hypothetical protein